ncbi:MAG: thioesterase [Flavobacteriales bacterium]|nr:MAG: thioesterase [Flavobacteriales bacterium]
MSYRINFKSKWADFDPNGHMRHTAYNDYAAEARVRFFKEHGYNLQKMQALNMGPILFNENTNFYKEIRISEDFGVELFLEGLSKNAERFKVLHKIVKENGEMAASISVYGAFLDLKERKLTTPPAEAIALFARLEKADNYHEIPLKSKVEL